MAGYRSLVDDTLGELHCPLLAACGNGGGSQQRILDSQRLRYSHRSTLELSDGPGATSPMWLRIPALPMFYLLFLSIGMVAGLRAMTAPAAVSWAAYLGWLKLDQSMLAFMGYTWTPWVITALDPETYISAGRGLLTGARRGAHLHSIEDKRSSSCMPITGKCSFSRWC